MIGLVKKPHFHRADGMHDRTQRLRFRSGHDAISSRFGQHLVKISMHYLAGLAGYAFCKGPSDELPCHAELNVVPGFMDDRLICCILVRPAPTQSTVVPRLRPSQLQRNNAYSADLSSNSLRWDVSLRLSYQGWNSCLHAFLRYQRRFRFAGHASTLLDKTILPQNYKRQSMSPTLPGPRTTANMRIWEIITVQRTLK
jgi:hypothetical protein